MGGSADSVRRPTASRRSRRTSVRAQPTETATARSARRGAPEPLANRIGGDGEVVNRGKQPTANRVTRRGQAGDGETAVAAAIEMRPDVILMDVRMPGIDGLTATEQILEVTGETTRVIMLTTFDLDEYVYEAIRIGASGFLLKDAMAAALVEAVRVVAAGDALLAPSVTKRLISDLARRPVAARASSLDMLTDREREVLVQVARGLSNSEIAGELFVSEQTVKTHVSRILTKVNLRDRAQAVVVAYEAGIVL